MLESNIAYYQIIKIIRSFSEIPQTRGIKLRLDLLKQKTK